MFRWSCGVPGEGQRAAGRLTGVPVMTGVCPASSHYLGHNHHLQPANTILERTSDPATPFPLGLLLDRNSHKKTAVDAVRIAYQARRTDAVTAGQLLDTPCSTWPSVFQPLNDPVDEGKFKC